MHFPNHRSSGTIRAVLRRRQGFVSLVAGMVMSSLASGAWAQVNFNVAPNFPVGTYPNSVAAGDFNGDGKQDLAVANRGGGNVSILIGNGSDAFAAAVNFGVGAQPFSVAVGDFNGDGKQDLAVANYGSNSVSILLGDGSGGFAAAVNVGVGSLPSSVAVGDFNGDGKQDLAVANYGNNSVLILLGNGSGGIVPAANVGVGSNPNSVAVGDFNGDGKQDLAVANYGSNSVSILLGNGSGGIAGVLTFGVGASPFSVAVGDFNGDGKQDLAVTNLNSNDVSILTGNGVGGFSRFNFYAGSYPVSVAVGDFNGDGKQDLAVANLSSNVSILIGNGSGGFAAAVKFGVRAQPMSVAVGDFNGDGKQDLAVANNNSNNVSILTGDGSGSFAGAVNFVVGSTPQSVAVGDFNGDGKQDVAVANRNSNNVSILIGNGLGGFAAAVNFGAGSGPFSVAVGDFNGDGKQDLAVANSTSNNVSILIGDGSGSFAGAVNFVVGSTPRFVLVGDFDGDGKKDLAVSNYDSDSVSILIGNGSGGFAAAVNFGVATHPYSMVVGDFNGDGKQDLAVANFNSNNISILIGDGLGGFAAAVNFGVGSGPYFVAAGDFNGDGKLDLAVAINSNYASILIGDGLGGFAAAVNFGVGITPYSVAVGDFNGDGKQDLAVANYNSNAVSILLNATPMSCLAGAWSPNGLDLPAACTAATTGHYVPGSGATSETACLAGSFQPLTGQTSCTPASAGSFVAASASPSETACSPGSYQPLSGQTSCLPANAGSFVLSSGASSQTACSAGSYQPSTGQTSCLSASAGSFVLSSGASSQTACSAGSYQPSTGQTSCLLASAGSFVLSSGASSQNACSAGSYQPSTGQASCIPASAGFFVPATGATAQIACAPGFTSDPGATVCISATPPSTVPNPPTIGMATPANGSATVTFAAPGNDGGSPITGYTATCGAQSAPGTTPTITVSGLPNDVPVTCTVHATNGVGNSAESAASNSVTPSVQTLSVNASSVTEGSSLTKNFNLSITRSGGTAAQTFSWVAAINGTGSTFAATPEDFGTTGAPCDTPGATCGTITFPAAGANTRNFALPGLINGDTKYELSETFTVAISSAGPIGTAAAAMTITSDDTVVPVVSLSAPGALAAEGTGGPPTPYTFTVTMNRKSYQPVTVSLSSTALTATTPADYTIPASVTIPADAMSATFDVLVVPDSLNEANETFMMTLNTITTSNATFGATITRTGTITDDDTAPTVKITSAGPVTEGGLVVFDINLSALSGKTVSVKVTTANGTTNPASAADYVNPGVQTITFMPGETYKSHSVQTVDDGNEELTEYIKATLGTFVNTSLLIPADGTAEGAIDDDGDVLTVSIDDQADTDAAGTNQVMTFNAKLSGTSWQTVKMNVATADGTATAGSDYTQKVVQNLTFTPGQTAKTFTATVLADALVEGMETFQVQALPPTTGPANIVLTPTPFGTGTITDTPTTTGLIISEFRFRGPNGPEDEFIEVKNNTSAPIAVLSLPAGPGVGLTVKKSDGTVLFTIPNGTTIRAGAHYLGVNSNGYSLAGYSGAGKAAANVSWIGDVAEAGEGIALMNAGTLIDAVGFAGALPGFSEGTPLPTAYDVDGQYSHVRKTPVNGPTKDTNDNASDFEFVATYASPTDPVFKFGGPTAAVGSPGPENLASPTEKSLAEVSVTLLDPGVAQSGNPNRTFTSGAYIYNTRSYPGGMMDLRRTITNNTSATITRIRFQALDITTKNGHVIFTPIQNDVRWINAPAETAVPTTLGPKNTVAATLDAGVGIGDEGGAINSSVTLAVSIAPGASINVHLRLAFASATDPFRFVFGVEALPQQ